MGKLKGWVYCGSHNATVSAWGKFTVSRESKQPKMNIRYAINKKMIEDRIRC